MIKNDRQYRLTKSQLKTFEGSINASRNMPSPPGLDPKLAEAHRQALEAQAQELRAELDEYKALSEGRVKHFTVESFGELPNMLIRARIARGFTQKQLAEKLLAKEQQVQRWEAGDYAGASIETLKRVMEALGIESRKEFFVPDDRLQPRAFIKNLETAGIPQELTLRRLLPPSLAAAFEGPASSGAGFREIVQASSLVSRVFAIPLPALLTPNPPRLNMRAVAATQFKLPTRAKPAVVNAYTLYAHYLAATLVSCVEQQPKRELTTDWHLFHLALSSPGEPMTFSKVLTYLWDCGILVLPLRDPGAFHGAVWKIGEYFVITLKQTTALAARLLYDLLHETGHIARGHLTGDESVLEDEQIAPGKRNEAVEEEANEWAEDALFDGESEQIEQACVADSAGNLKRLKAVLPQVARRYNVSTGVVANYMAYRLADQGENWWGAANNLQLDPTDPFDQARAVLLQHVNLNRLAPTDRDLLMRALTEG
jgi:transcriptional regulator with XRE-family HTH domain